MELDSIDRISELPDFVIHGILSLLPRKDAVRTSVLSKLWNRVWETFPDFDFDQLVYTGIPEGVPELTPERVRRIGGFLDIARRSLLRSTRCSVVGIKFSLNTSVFDDPGLSSDLNRCFESALRSRAAAIHVFNRAPGGAALPEIVFVSDYSLRCSSLRELTLCRVRLSEESLSGVFLSCPNVRKLDLLSVAGLAKLEVRDLDRLDTLNVVLDNVPSIDIIADAPRLRRLHFTGYLHGTTTTWSLTSCRSLTELLLAGLDVTDEWVCSLATLCPLLEDLTVCYCHTLRKVTVSGKHLARLVLDGCSGIEAVEVDAPALASFMHRGEALPRFSFKSVPSQSEVVHDLVSHVITTWRFVDLRKFLSVNGLTDCFTVMVVPLQVVFDREELSQVVVPAAVQLEHLKLELMFEDPSFDKQDLIDGLLWCFHPRTISVFSFITPHSCLEVLSESLLEMEENPTCCGSSGAKCWRHGLKSARAESSDGESGPNDLVIRFELEWDDDSIW